jgi:CBS-domain-containing membrane protein
MYFLGSHDQAHTHTDHLLPLAGTLTAIRYANPQFERSSYTAILGSFGASAVILFAAPESPFSQPRNVFLGQILSAVIGILCRLYVAAPMGTKALALPLAVSFSLVAMMATRSVHPPAGGTTAIMVLSSAALDELGWAALVPVCVGSLLCLIWASLVNNLNPKARYPLYYFLGERQGLCI